jgi:ABC-type hemin transport system ATPase subunit
VIEARNLTKRYGDKTAVEDLSFTVEPGIVTGFLGPNGTGKSTTMRLSNLEFGGRSAFPSRPEAQPLAAAGPSWSDRLQRLAPSRSVF